MATYKVPQDVEAEDKLLGPFTFRQFIYLVVVAIAMFLAYGLGRVFWGLALLPLPIILFFLVLALPLKKDQPMETYLTAVVRFWLKPRTRVWDPEGNMTLVEIVAPTTAEAHLTKDFSGEEASMRLSYLSQIVDTGGWASRGLTSPIDNVHISDTILAEATQAQDMFDAGTNVAQNFTTMIDRSDAAHKQAMLASMRMPSTAVSTPVQPQSDPVTPHAPQDYVVAAPTTQDTGDDTTDETISFNPYPSNMHQKVITPHQKPKPVKTPRPPEKQPQAPSPEAVSPDIIRLAANKDLSISTLAREAERLHKKHLEENEEVVVSLR